MNTSRALVLLGGFILVIGAFLPWISVPDLFGLMGPAYESIEVGWEGDGIVTGWIGVIIEGKGWKAILGARRRPRSYYSFRSPT